MAEKRLSKKINDLFAREAWSDAREILLGELTKKPKDHWLLTRLGTTYYEERNYTKALGLTRQAQKLAPRCPLVLWDLACSLHMMGEDKKAAQIYLNLLRKGPIAIAHDECGEGEEWAINLLADCWFSLGACYQDMNKPRKALACFRKYADLLAMGVPGIYPLENVQKRIRSLIGKRSRFIEKNIGAIDKELLKA